jgi:hypothetical protein
VGLDDDEDDDKLKKSDRSVPLSFITENADRESILRAVIDRELDRLKYRRLAAWFAYLERRAQLGVPSQGQIERLAEIKASRDILVHNRGVVNQTYLIKSGTRARSSVGQRLEIDEPYLKPRLFRMAAILRDRRMNMTAYADHLMVHNRRATPTDPTPALEAIVADHRATGWKTLSVFVRDCVGGNCFPIDGRVRSELQRYGLPPNERLLVSLSLLLNRNPRQIARMFYESGGEGGDFSMCG